MMKVLLKNELKSTLNTVRTQKTSNLVGYLVALIVILVFLGFASVGVWRMSDSFTDSILGGLLSYGSLGMIGFILLLGVPQVFKDLYATGDLELLFTLPIKTRHIFWVKYLKSFAGTPLFAFILFIVPLFTYGIAAQVNLLYYPVVVFVILAVLVIGLSIAFLFNLVLIQIVPASRANEFMTVMSVFSGLFVYLLFMLPNMMNDKPMAELILAELPLFPAFTPMHWVSHAVVEASNGSVQFLLPLILIVLLSVFSLILATSLVEKGFRTGWIRLSEGSNKKKKKRKKRSSHQLSHPVMAIGKKEWYAIKRDIREWMILMPIAFFFIFGLIGFISGGGDLSDLRQFNDISWPVAQGVFLFMFIFTSSLIAASSIGREGASLWILKMLPVSGKEIARGKLWISWLIPLTLITIMELVVGLLLGWSVIQFILGFVIKAFVTLGLSAIGLWFGTIGAKYNPKNPQQRVNFAVSLFILIASIVYFIVIIIPFAYVIVPPVALVDLPTNLELGLTGIKGFIVSSSLVLLTWKLNHPILMYIVGVIVLAAISLGITHLFVYLSGRRIDRGIDIDMVSESKVKPLFGGKKSGGSLY